MEEAFAQAMQSVGPVGTLVLAFFANEWRKQKAASTGSSSATILQKMFRSQEVYHVKQEARHDTLVALLKEERKDHEHILQALKDAAA